MHEKSLEKLHARYKTGKGQGDGPDYVPWLGIRDVPSKGVTTQQPGRKTGRAHTVFSDLERATLLILQRMDDIVDLREQYPLWPPEDTLEIADRLGVRHPSTRAGDPIVMTTDILVTRGGRLEAIAVKPESDLREERTLIKLDIERVYWEARGIRWQLVTGRELPKDLIWNLDWIDEYYDINPEMLSADEVTRIEGQLAEKLTATRTKSPREICAEADDRLGHEPGTALAVFRNALARKRWSLPLMAKIEVGKPLPAVPTFELVSPPETEPVP